MLRCTAAGLLPLMNSKRYRDIADSLFAEKRKAFEAIVEHKSYDLLPALPKRMAKALLLPVLSELAARQQKNGLWRGKDGAKTSFGILSAMVHAELLEEAKLPYSPLDSLSDRRDEYALLIKRLLGGEPTQADREALAALRREIEAAQDSDGSFGQTVTGTVITLERLLALGIPQGDPVIQSGVQYLLAQRKPMLQGMHTSAAYGLSVPDIFTTEDRNAEFQAAVARKPEWLPRHVCFHTMGMIPNALCLNLLLKLGLEDDPGVSAALQSLYALYRRHGGFCATDIKKPYLQTGARRNRVERLRIPDSRAGIDNRIPQKEGIGMAKKITPQTIALCGMMAAVIFVATWLFKVPMPLAGYIHLGDGFILIAAVLLGWPAVLSAALGSMLADLLAGYSMYMLPTFLIKGAVAAIAVFASQRKNQPLQMLYMLAAEAVMVIGYIVADLLLYNWTTASADILGNLFQGLSAVAIWMILLPVARRIRKLPKPDGANTGV